MGSLTSPNVYRSSLQRLTRAALASAALTLALAGGLTCPASAATPPGRVAFGDLDIGAPAGAKVLLARIEIAAREACGGQPDHSPLLPRATAQFRACASEAVNQAVDRLNAPLVAALLRNEPNSASITLASR